MLNEKETEHAIKLIKDTFQSHLSTSLKLRRVTAPLFVKSGILSAYHGFFGNKHFSRANEYLTAHGESPIQW